MRHKHWQIFYGKITEAYKDKPFKWGEHDCVLWAANVVAAITGEDYGAEWRGTYDSALSAARLLESLGGAEALVTKFLGQPIPVAMANVGDVLLLKQGDWDMLAICNGQTMLAPGPKGLAVHSTLSALKAWKV
jgi:hypothetical protein